jgi:hypothetical protein
VETDESDVDKNGPISCSKQVRSPDAHRLLLPRRQRLPRVRILECNALLASHLQRASDWHQQNRCLPALYSDYAVANAALARVSAARSRALNVLMVGSERSDEFAAAVRLAERGHSVIVINPRQSGAARQFANTGGRFIRTTIEQLPLVVGPFDLICESYPFTVARVKGICEDHPCPMWLSARTIHSYAMARLRHLAPRGRWIVFTESPGFAGALRSLAYRDKGIRCKFSVRIVPLASDEAPPSSYPHLSTRFQVIFQRRSAEPRLKNGVPARTAFL